MTLDEFVTKYRGKKPDYDGVYGAQCVDLIKLYAKEVVGSPVLTGNAKDMARNQYPADYGYNHNYPLYIPPPGAIAIWNGKVGGGFGHAAIVLEAHLMWFRSLDLNWPTGSAVKEVRHNYANVKGFLLPKPRANLELYNELVEELRALAVKYRKM